MCDALSIAMATTTAAGGMMASMSQNKASRANAEAIATQANNQMAGSLIETLTAAAENARARFKERVKTAENIGTLRANFAEVMGTPRNELERMMYVDAAEAEWSFTKADDMIELEGLDKLEGISLAAAGQISQLPTSSVTSQIMGVANAAVSGLVMHKTFKSLEAHTAAIAGLGGGKTPTSSTPTHRQSARSTRPAFSARSSD